MEYIELLKQMIFECRDDADRFLSGDKQEYLYCYERTKEHGDSDKNYTNRTRLCYGLMYGGYSLESIEAAVRELFETEIISREKASFQGIGVNIEILTVLLRNYNNPNDEKLFERAKNANFDCYCGYDKNLYADWYKTLDEFSIEACVHIAGELGKTDYACKFVDIFKRQPLGLKELQQLKTFAEYDTYRMCDKEIAVTGIYENFLSDPPENTYEQLAAVESYVLLLADKGDADKAADIFIEHIRIFDNHNRTCYEIGSRLIRDRASKKDDVWKLILPLIEKEFDRIAPVNYAPLAEAADIMDEAKLAQKLRKTGEKKFEAIQKEMGKLRKNKN